MQRIAIYAFSALALATALWLVWPSSGPDGEHAAAPGSAAEQGGEPRAAGSSASQGGVPAAGANAARSGSSASGASASANAGPQRTAHPAADAESLAAAEGSDTGTTGSGAEPGSDTGESAEAGNAPPLPVIAGTAPAPAPAGAAPTPGGIDPADLVSDPNLPPPDEGAVGVDRQRLMPREIWERVQEQCPDCTPEQQAALYTEIDQKSGIAEALTHPR